MIRFTVRAIADIRRLREFLAPKNPDAAVRAMHEIWRTLDRLDRNPRLGHPTRSPEVRQARVHFGKHGYVIRYSSKEAPAIVILRIWHGREDRG